MRIPPTAPPRIVRRTASVAQGPGEPAATTDHAPAVPSTAAPLQTASVATLVALAAIDEQRERRRRDAAHAEAGLDALEALEAELAAGPVSEERLLEIAAWSASIALPEDPQLAAILAAIDLRAQVELAKHAQARGEVGQA